MLVSVALTPCHRVAVSAVVLKGVECALYRSKTAAAAPADAWGCLLAVMAGLEDRLAPAAGTYVHIASHPGDAS